jgi:hypothetical protein
MTPAPVPTTGHCPIHGLHPIFTFQGVWFRADEAAAFVGCKHRCGCPSVKAFWNWRKRYQVISHRGLIAKADLDRIIRNTTPIRRIA